LGIRRQNVYDASLSYEMKRDRMKIRKRSVAAIVLGLTPTLLSAAPKASVSLVPSVEGIVPGVPFEVGVRFELDENWHIYWVNSGDSGLPPRITWKFPEGFTQGEVVFPIPKRHHSPGDIVTNILPGKPMLVTKVTPPSTISEKQVTLGAEVAYLVCNDKCLREQAHVGFDLPVLQPGSEAPPANKKLFKRARRAAPKASSKYLTVVAEGSPKILSPGSAFELVLTIDIKRGYHIQSNKPTMPSLIAADLFLEPTKGVEFGAPIYPKAHLRSVPHLGKLSEFEGKIKVRIPATVDAEITGGPLKVGGVLRYQACTNKGSCMPPDGVAFHWTSSVKGSGNAAPIPAEKLAAGDAAPERSSTSAPEASDDKIPVAAGGENHGDVTATPAPTDSALEPGTSANDDDLESFLKRLGPVGLLFGCFLYGLFINATPCVLPLLSIKVLGFVQQAHESRRRTMMLGLSFGAGVLVFFVLLGLLAAQGKNILQFPTAIIVLGGIVMALSLSMLGVFTLQAPATAATLEAKIGQEGLGASFGKGALAPVLGFACTGPMLAGAWGWATQQPPQMATLAFLFTGLGMASPYMLLGANPNWLSFLPKPGNWMITFERVMGFLLLAMVIWLIHPLIIQIGPEGLEWTLGFYVALAMGCWLWGKVQFTMPAGQRWRYRGGALALIAISALMIYGWIYPLGPAIKRARADLLAGTHGGSAASPNGIAWRRWTPEAVEEVVRSGRVAFVDFTAAYCTVCKVNKKVAVNTKEFAEKVQEIGAVTFRGDFTFGDPDIFEELEKHGRGGVPLNLIYPAGRPDAPLVLRPQLTKSYLLEKLDEAARLGVRTASAHLEESP